MTDSRIYPAHFLYWLLTALCVVLALLFAWQLIERWEWGTLLFLLVALWSALRCIKLMSSRVVVGTDRVRVEALLQTPQEVAFRQLAAVHEEGRGLKSIHLLYYPRSDAGIVTTDDTLTLSLPAVNDHKGLLAALVAQVPA